MFCFNLGEAAVDELFYSRFTFNLSFFFRFSTWKWLLSLGNHAIISSITIRDWVEIFWFVIALLLYRKSAILELSFLNPKNLSLPNQFSKAICQYILNLMSKKKLGCFNDWINAYFQSFIICLLPHGRYEHFSGQHFFQNFLGVSEHNSANLGKSSGKHYEVMKIFDHWQI